jgi:hypothetical protein
VVPNGVPTLTPATVNAFPNASSAGSTGVSAVNNQINADIKDAYDNAFNVPLEYADQLPPFDITLTMVDSQGAGAYMVIGGVEILNEGGGFTVDDMTNQTVYTYVARFLKPLTPIDSKGRAKQ